MGRGRPAESEIRANIIEILYFMKRGYGYEISKVYNSVFSKVTMRSIYYHLKKGCETGEIKVNKVEKEKGDYSWGSESEKVYYELGKNARPQMDKKVKAYFDKAKKK